MWWRIEADHPVALEASLSQADLSIRSRESCARKKTVHLFFTSLFIHSLIHFYLYSKYDLCGLFDLATMSIIEHKSFSIFQPSCMSSSGLNVLSFGLEMLAPSCLTDFHLPFRSLLNHHFPEDLFHKLLD